MTMFNYTTLPGVLSIQNTGISVERFSRVYRSTSQTGMSLPSVIEWEAVYGDPNTWSVSNPSRLTIPSGVSLVQFRGAVWPRNDLTPPGSIFRARLLKNGAYDANNTSEFYRSRRSTGIADMHLWFTSGILSVSPGDYFEVQYHYTQTSGSVVFDGVRSGCFLEMEKFA